MKTTVEISDALLDRTRRVAKRSGRSVRSMIEEGLRLVLQAEGTGKPYRMEDHRVGKKGDPNPLASMSWEELRAEIYGDR